MGSQPVGRRAILVSPTDDFSGMRKFYHGSHCGAWYVAEFDKL